MSDYLIPLALSLGLTLIFELVYSICVGVRGRDVLLIVMMNVITNPVTVFLTLMFGYKYRWIEYPLEVGVVVVEWLLLRRFAVNVNKPFWLAVGLNLFSYGAGLIVTAFI
ncbi:MAG: hypothetical protein PHT58_06985 [Eubacteriales bacterium]|nr:hypothetical protein [Eubacteriales bacterium]